MNANANLDINHKVHLNTNTIIIAKRHNKNYKTTTIPTLILVDRCILFSIYKWKFVLSLKWVFIKISEKREIK